MPLLELLAMLLATPGAIVALRELRARRSVSRKAALRRVIVIDLRVRLTIRRK
jgi:hypothetical protein